MSEENPKLVRRWVDAINIRDEDAFLAVMDEEVECVSRIVSMEGPLRGHEGARRWWESWFAAFPDYKLEIVEMEVLGSLVLGGFRAAGHGAGSAVPFEDVAWNLSDWRNGKCIWWQVFTDKDEALEAATSR